jgi:hypothetical protein
MTLVAPVLFPLGPVVWPLWVVLPAGHPGCCVRCCRRFTSLPGLHQHSARGAHTGVGHVRVRAPRREFLVRSGGAKEARRLAPVWRLRSPGALPLAAPRRTQVPSGRTSGEVTPWTEVPVSQPWLSLLAVVAFNRRSAGTPRSKSRERREEEQAGPDGAGS